MYSRKKIGIPENFDELLPDLKSKTLKWEAVCYSGTKINSSSTITFHQPVVSGSYGTLILIPGLATNNDFDPLMKSITYWALTHKYNVVHISTFINDFMNPVSPEQLAKNTYQEFQDIINQSLTFIQPYTLNQYSMVIGHCASANGIIDAFNNRVKNSEEIPVSSALLFAPWPKTPSQEYENSVLHLLTNEIERQSKMSELDFISKIKLGHMNFLYSMNNFRSEIDNVTFEPDLMVKWDIPVTFVAAQRDKLSKPERVQKNYETLAGVSNNFKYLYLVNRKHSFEKLYTDSQAIINLIKSQKPKRR